VPITFLANGNITKKDKEFFLAYMRLAALHYSLPFDSQKLLGMILFYANLKFDWRKDYVEGEPFILESYMSEYPTMEQNTFGGLLGEKRWVQFADDCVKPSMGGVAPPPTCRSKQNIIDEYNIDPTDLINNRFKIMKRTAQRIEDGELKTKRAYQQCLMNKTCAIIPLLPANVDPEKIDQQSEDYIETRRMFWSLINDTQISPEICEYIDLCRVLRNSGVVPIEEPDTSIKQ
jgi:hypothetical protein